MLRQLEGAIPLRPHAQACGRRSAAWLAPPDTALPASPLCSSRCWPQSDNEPTTDSHPRHQPCAQGWSGQRLAELQDGPAGAACSGLAGNATVVQLVQQGVNAMSWTM